MSKGNRSSYWSEVKPKKFLGQHFLTDEAVAEQIAGSLNCGREIPVLEIGTGMGVLTNYLKDQHAELFLIELDSESVIYIKEHFPELKDRITEGDVLKQDWSVFGDKMAVIGNYPYNISSQILFKVLDEKERVVMLSGMFQKEVAERVVSGPGNKDYGILSVLLQVWFDCEYLFTVDATAFHPPPRVKSGVIRLTRNSRKKMNVDEQEFKKVVKQAFNQRRKTLRNSLRSMCNSAKLPYASMRPEQLTWQQFEELTDYIYKFRSEFNV